jgi:putative sterol carrier protein
MEIKTPKEFFDKVLPAKFDAGKTAGLEAIVQINLTGANGGSWIVIVKDQKLDVKQGVHQSPTITVEMTDNDYLDVVNGKLAVEKAFMGGKLKFKGNIMVGLRLKDIGIA